MAERYELLPVLRARPLLAVAPRTAERIGLTTCRRLYLWYGTHAVEVEIELDNTLEEQELCITQDSLEALRVPMHLPFALRREGANLHIGPSVGILAARTEAGLASMVHVLSHHLQGETEPRGAVLACSVEGLDLARDEVRGYLYNPRSGAWEAGVYSLPRALFKRVPLPAGVREALHERLGNRVFNNYLLSKWEMHQWLHPFAALRPHLPATILLRKPRDLIRWIKQRQDILIKPTTGSQGQGIVRMQGRDEGQVAVWRDEANDREPRLFPTAEQAATWWWEHKASACIAQQRIVLMQHHEQAVDFRVLLAKDGSGEWQAFGTVARFGAPGRQVSNISRGGRAMMAQEALVHELGWSEQKAARAVADMEALAVEAGRALDACGPLYGNLGVDLALDVAGQLWLLELNNLDPNHTIAIDAGNRSLFYALKRANLHYAQRLAGFY